MATDSEARAALDANERRLSRMANVVGLGVVETGGPGHGSAVAVYVRRKLPRRELSADDLVPATLQVESAAGTVDVPTRVIEQGPVTLEELPGTEGL